MRELFPGYYPLTKDELSKSWHEGIITFDTNVLLHVYRYNDKVLKSFFDVLEIVKDRIWIAHQAALEFHDNRVSVIQGRGRHYRGTGELLTNSFQSLEQALNKLKEKAAFFDVDIDSIISLMRKSTDEAKQIVKEATPDSGITALLDSDEIRDRLNRYIEGKIGSAYSDIETIYEMAEKRVSLQIPPGYEDLDKRDFKRYGDVIFWLQLIDHAKSTRRPLILVVDDAKQDWWVRDKSGKPVSPRPELIQEMLNKAGVSIYMYRSEEFLADAPKFFPTLQIDDSVLEEARKVRLQSMESGNDMLISDITITGGMALTERDSASVNLTGPEFVVKYYNPDYVRGMSLGNGLSLSNVMEGSGHAEYKGIKARFIKGHVRFSGSPQIPYVVDRVIPDVSFTASGNVKGYATMDAHYHGEPCLFDVTFSGSGIAKAVLDTFRTPSSNPDEYFQQRIEYIFTDPQMHSST